MRIAFLVGGFPPWTEMFILNQITGLIDRGHEVDIYAGRPTPPRKVHPDVIKYGLLNRTCYKTQMPKNRLLRLLKAIGLVLVNLHKNPIALLRSLNVFKYGEQAASLNLLYSTIPLLSRKKPYDIIHCHFGNCGILGAYFREIRILNGKLITTFHGSDITKYTTAKGENVYDTLFEKADLFLPISKRWRTRLIELGCDEKKIIVHHMGVCLKEFPFRPRTLDSSDKVRIITIARLTEKKGLQYGIRALGKLTEFNKNIEYNIIGDGPLRKDLTLLITESGLAHTVKLLGWRDHCEVIDLLNGSHILLAPSVTSANGDQEGIPVSIMEAMAMGIPVVSTQHSGIPELVQDGVSGFLVPERDVVALVEKLGYLIRHPEIWPEMGRAGRAFVEEHYDINKLNNRLVEIYRELLLDL